MNDSRDAWRQFCDRLAALGDRVLEDDFPHGERALAEGFRHLATQTVAWTSWAVGYGDPAYPAFFRQNDLVVKWGGPNVDQVSRRARVVPDGLYRITGQMNSCEDFILTLKTGDMHADTYGIGHEVMASEIGLGPGDDIDIVVSADEQPGTWVPLPRDATLLNIREYYWDWQPAPPAIFAIERLDTQGTAPAPITPERVSTMLDEAAHLVESSVSYWNRWVATERAKLPANTMGPPGGSAGGSSRIRYSFGFFDLEPHQALLIEADPVDARFWDVQLYNLGWFESLDFPNRTTSLNHTQGVRSADGRLRFVLTRDDPGVANWIDTEERRTGMVTFRWVACSASAVPTIASRVVDVTDLHAVLPTDTRRVDAAERREEIRRRQAHVAWRYRT